MKTPRLTLSLIAATLMAATGPARADALHNDTGLAGAMVGPAKSLSSNLTLRADLVPPRGLPPESIEAGAQPTGHIKPDLSFSRTHIDLRAGPSGAAPMLGGAPSGPHLTSLSQAVLDRELALLRDGIGRARLVSQVSLGAYLRF